MNDILSGTYKGNTYRIKVECYPNTPAIKVQLIPVNAGERITMTQNRRTAAVFQFHSAALRRLNKVGCQRYEGDYTRLKQKHAERRARRMAG